MNTKIIWKLGEEYFDGLEAVLTLIAKTTEVIKPEMDSYNVSCGILALQEFNLLMSKYRVTGRSQEFEYGKLREKPEYKGRQGVAVVDEGTAIYLAPHGLFLIKYDKDNHLLSGQKYKGLPLSSASVQYKDREYKAIIAHCDGI